MVAERTPTAKDVTAVASSPDITLQINLCASDLSYAEKTVTALIATHRPDVREVLVVADGCRPQSTPWLDADRRFPAAAFAARVAQLRELCASLEAKGVVDRTVWLDPNPPALRSLNTRYGGTSSSHSHDHLGHAFSAYFLGWDSARTRYVAHFDADIILWQQPGFSWLSAATAAIANDEMLLAVSPRIAPPPAGDDMVHVEAAGSGWLPTWPLARTTGGWHSPWFSTRCHLMDRDRLQCILPLTSARGHAADLRAARIDSALSPLYRHGFTVGNRLGRVLSSRIPPFPLPPEVLLHEHAQRSGHRCLYLGDPRAWFIHPDTKSDTFLHLLPRLLEVAGQRGACPAAQRGVSGVQFSAWAEFSI